MSGPMRGGNSASIYAENDFILNRLNHKESTPGDIKKHEEQIAEPIGCLIDYLDLFHEATQNMATDVEIPSNITNGLL